MQFNGSLKNFQVIHEYMGKALHRHMSNGNHSLNGDTAQIHAIRWCQVGKHIIFFFQSSHVLHIIRVHQYVEIFHPTTDGFGISDKSAHPFFFNEIKIFYKSCDLPRCFVTTVDKMMLRPVVKQASMALTARL